MHPPSQRSTIGKKYEKIYSSLQRAMKLLLDSGSFRDKSNYAAFKKYLLFTWVAEIHGKERDKVNHLKVLDTPAVFAEPFAAAMQEYFGEPTQWSENGVVVSGTRLDYEQRMDQLITEELLAAGAMQADAIIELGSGWGHRLFDLWNSGGPEQASYYAMERASTAWECVEQAKTIFPDMAVTPLPFDFLSPDYASIPKIFSRMLVFTSFAIEQVQIIGPRYLDALLARFPNTDITGVHIEPITFQLPEEKLNNPSRFHTDYNYAIKKNYNMDLVDVLRAHPAIEIVKTKAGVIDLGTGNSGSVVVWRRKSKS